MPLLPTAARQSALRKNRRFTCGE